MARIQRISSNLRDALDERISEYEHGSPYDDGGRWVDRVAELLYEFQAITE